MLIPAWHVAVLWSLYAVVYGLHVWRRKAARYRYIGKVAGRLIVAAVYLWVAFVPMDADTRAVWIRWSLFIFPIIDLIFVAQERFEEKLNNARPS